MNASRRSLYQPQIGMDRDPQLDDYQRKVSRRNRRIVFVVIGFFGSIVLMALAYHFFGQAELWYSA